MIGVGRPGRGRRVRFVSAVLALPALAGCGSDDPQAVSVAEPTPTFSATAIRSPETRALSSFRTPSGNVGCAVDRAGVRCDVREATWAAPSRPASCRYDWGRVLNLDASGARFLCHSDSALDPEAPVLAYGTTNRVAGYVCTATEQALRCEHGRSGHGFTLSRSTYQVF